MRVEETLEVSEAEYVLGRTHGGRRGREDSLFPTVGGEVGGRTEGDTGNRVGSGSSGGELRERDGRGVEPRGVVGRGPETSSGD